MNEFKILSIDEFDALFVKELRVPKAAPPKISSGLIPEIIKTENDTASDLTQTNITDDVSSFSEEKKSDSAEEIKSDSEIITSVSFSSDSDNNNADIFEAVDEVEITETQKKKNNGGYLAGKIVSVVMLCVTAVTFLLGCFVSVFLNNNGLDIGGICFNNQTREITVGSDTIKENSLIISKNIDSSEYIDNLNKPVAVPVDSGRTAGCDIMFLYSVGTASENDVEIEVYDPMTNEISNESYLASECFGIVTHYIPAVGGILLFAINNAVLVCALFVLLAAFWCLLLVLIEKNAKKKD